MQGDSPGDQVCSVMTTAGSGTKGPFANPLRSLA